MGRFSVVNVVSGDGLGWRYAHGMEGYLFYLPVEDIVTSWRAEGLKMGVRRMDLEECLKAFVKQ